MPQADFYFNATGKRAFIIHPFSGLIDPVTKQMPAVEIEKLERIILILEDAGYTVFSAMTQESYGSNLKTPKQALVDDERGVTLADLIVAFPFILHQGRIVNSHGAAIEYGILGGAVDLGRGPSERKFFQFLPDGIDLDELARRFDFDFRCYPEVLKFYNDRIVAEDLRYRNSAEIYAQLENRLL